MKTPTYTKNLLPGLTLIEVTIVMIVMMTLIFIFYFTAQGYISESNRTNCLAVQSKIKKNVLSYGMLFHPLQDGVEYYANNAVEAEFGNSPKCPETGGTYSALLDEDGEGVTVTCVDRAGEHIHH